MSKAKIRPVGATTFAGLVDLHRMNQAFLERSFASKRGDLLVVGVVGFFCFFCTRCCGSTRLVRRGGTRGVRGSSGLPPSTLSPFDGVSLPPERMEASAPAGRGIG